MTSFVARLVWVILLTCPLWPVSVNAAESKTVTTVGVAMAGTEASRRLAVEDALRNAVEEGMGAYVTADLMVQNKQIVDEKILSQTEGYIQSYSILDEEQKNGLYRVRIEAKVKLGKIRSDLDAVGLLLKRKKYPRVMVVVSASAIDDFWEFGKQHVPSVKNVIEQILLKNKFRLVDYAQHKIQEALAQSKGDTPRLSQLAKDAGAEIIIVVNATRYYERTTYLYGSAYRMYRSNVQLRALESGTGRVISSHVTEGQSSATLDPLHEAAEIVAARGIEDLLQKWSRDVANTTTLNLVVQKVEFAQLIKLENEIKLIHGIAVVNRRSFAERVAHFDLEFRGDADTLVKRLAKLKNPPLSITGISKQTIDAEIKP